MSATRCGKVRQIVALRARAAGLQARHAAGLARLAPLRHRAEQLQQEARVLKARLTPCELAELRRAWSGV